MTYTPPTPQEMREILKALGLTGAATADLLDKASGRQVRRWTGGHSKMAYTDLYTLIHKTTGVAITKADWREEIQAGLTNYAS
ncbi:MAG: hypothetical protein AAF442_05090 [Pseudomonadota bacterium]